MAAKNFHHPFQPYDIQQQFMQAVYDCIEDGKVGIFESPTGTGKSLSLLCGSLTWLREHKRKQFDESLQQIEIDEDEPQWLVKHHQEARKKEAARLREDFEQRLDAIRKNEESLKRQSEVLARKTKKQKTEDADTIDDEHQYLLDDYESDNEATVSKTNGDAYSADTTKLLQSLGLLYDASKDRKGDEVIEETKIFFCSRTHSQLSQSVGELRRIRLPPGFPPADATADSNLVEQVRQISLGSRKNLCINPTVQKLNSQAAINERCLELQQSSSGKSCEFLPKKDDAEQMILDFRDHALSRLRDIEDLATVGEKLGICPYYASRAAIAPAEIITLPYPLLLQRAAREAMGLSLRGHVIIIDEAHNLMDAVESTYSSQITNEQLQRARESLIVYLQKFRNRLKGSNRTYLAQIIRVIDSLSQALQSLKDASGEMQPQTLLQGKGIDQINLSKLARYISESKLARKLESYATSRKQVDAVSSYNRSADNEAAPETPTLTILQNFILSLINPTAEGRFFWNIEGSKVTLRYLLLDPAHHFKDIVEESRAIILAGGTMSPMDDIIRQLFPYLTDIRTLSCGHIVPTSSLLVRAVSRDDQGLFEFNYRSRQDKPLIKRLGSFLCDIVTSTKGGMVVFFASYAYLELVRKQWLDDETMTMLKSRTAVFFDSRMVPAEQTFQLYSDSIHRKTANQSDGKSRGGAILFSVIGGKLSEGINFSDELGRCIVVIGMPFPNLETPEWKAKLKHLEMKGKNTNQKSMSSDTNMSREYAENICMRAVNQAIGRAIRHKQDWASILLLDSRYEQTRIQNKLPAWIRGSLPEHPPANGRSTTRLCADLKQFFER